MSASGGIKRGWVTSSFDNEDVEPREKIRPVTNRKVNKMRKDEVLWIEKYQPQRKEDLAVNKKKIQDVEDWLMKCFTKTEDNHLKSSILLLTGPTGIGKSATVKTLAKHLNVDVKEWLNQISDTRNESYTLNKDENYSSSLLSLPYESQIKKFWDFVLRANRYATLSFVNEDEKEMDRRIILIEEFPNIFIQNTSDFHSILRRFNKASRSPIIFIISDNIKDLNARLLFPQDIQQELRMATINFNPIATTNLSKALTKIASAELSPIPSKSTIDRIVQMSSGDIRMAINTLQFSYYKSGSKNVRSQREKKTDTQPDAIKDLTIYLFHAIGKILHCKRDSNASSDECDLPPHLKDMARLPLLSNPESIVNNSAVSADCLTLFIHHNYLKFNSDISPVIRGSNYLSDSDIVASEWTGKAILEECSSLIAVRGIMHCKKEASASGWHPIHKPYWYTANKLVWERKVLVKHWSKEFGLTNAEFLTELLPYKKLISRKSWNQDMKNSLRDLTTFPRNFTKREDLLEQDEMADSEDDVTNTEESSEFIALIDEDDFVIEDVSD